MQPIQTNAQAIDRVNLLGSTTGFNIIKSVLIYIITLLFWRNNYPNHTITKANGNTLRQLEVGDHASFFDANGNFCSGFYNGGENIYSQSSFDLQIN